jgi:D-alanyl-D-alanine carboxypeptidase
MGTFYTDVISKDMRFGSSVRVADIALLEPMTRQLVERLVSAAQQMGIELMIYETYRSQDRQQQFNSGASKLRTVGVHHYGLACDIVRSISGEASWKGDFTFLGQLAQSCALLWGGDWGAPQIKHSFIDSVHVQRCTVARQDDLFAGAGIPTKFTTPTTTCSISSQLRKSSRQNRPQELENRNNQQASLASLTPLAPAPCAYNDFARDLTRMQ